MTDGDVRSIRTGLTYRSRHNTPYLQRSRPIPRKPPIAPIDLSCSVSPTTIDHLCNSPMRHSLHTLPSLPRPPQIRIGLCLANQRSTIAICTGGRGAIGEGLFRVPAKGEYKYPRTAASGARVIVGLVHPQRSLQPFPFHTLFLVSPWQTSQI